MIGVDAGLRMELSQPEAALETWRAVNEDVVNSTPLPDPERWTSDRKETST